MLFQDTRSLLPTVNTYTKIYCYGIFKFNLPDICNVINIYLDPGQATSICNCFSVFLIRDNATDSLKTCFCIWGWWSVCRPKDLLKLKIVTTQLLPFLGVVFANCTFSSKFKVGSPNFIVTVHPFRKQKFVPVKQVLINFNIDYPY
jgi:hypothetical protein